MVSFSVIRQSKTLQTIAVFTTGNMVAMVLGTVGSLVQARYVGPEEMGIFRMFTIVLGYLTFLHLGIFDGLHRDLPIQLARGNTAKAEKLAAACLAWIVFISLVTSILFLALAVKAACYREWMEFWGWLAFIPGVVGVFYGGYLGATFRTGQQFVQLSKAAVLQSVAGTLVLPLMPFLNYYGACLRAAASGLVNVIYLHRWRPMRLRPRLDWTSFREVISIGLPLSIIGYIYTSLWISLEGTFVLEWYGKEMLGLYAVAVTIRTMVVQVAQNMNQVMSVKIFEQYGRTSRVKDCVHLIFKPVMLAVLLSIPAVAVGWIAVPWAVHLLIPKYVNAILMIQVMLFMMPLTFLNLPVNILWATGRKIDCFISVIVGFVAFVAISYLLYQLNVRDLSIPIASLLGQAINVLVSLVLIYKLMRRESIVNQLEIDRCVDSPLG